MRIEIGTRLRTSYNTGPYTVVGILRDCTCPKYLDEINMRNPPPSKPHEHYVVRGPNAHGDSYLGGYDGETQQSVWCGDSLIIEPPPREGVQITMELEAV